LGSSPSIWKEKGLVFYATKHAFWAPKDVQTCLEQKTPIDITDTSKFNYGCYNDSLDELEYSLAPFECIPDDVHIDSILALDIHTGEIVWSQRVQGVDIFNFGCYLECLGPFPNNNERCCVTIPGPAWGFDQAPILHEVDLPKNFPIESKKHYLRNVHKHHNEENDDDKKFHHGSSHFAHDDHHYAFNREMRVGALQKSGVFWSFRAIDGNFRWSRDFGPASAFGEGQWGAAYDQDCDTFFISMSGASSYVTEPQPPVTVLPDGQLICDSGFISATDALYGNVKWVAFPTFAKINGNCTNFLPPPIEVFKKGVKIEGNDGGVPTPWSETATVAEPCPVPDRKFSCFEEGWGSNHIHGPPAVVRGGKKGSVVFYGTLDGHVYGLNAKDGSCLIDMECPCDAEKHPGPIGGVFGGPSVTDEQVRFLCGYFPNFGNTFVQYHLP
jgi:outer membrane protein assembly factor BamB